MAMSVSERIEPEGERKLVTVLFADVQGSMDMAEQQDPEQWRSIMQRFFSVLADAVNRYEGTVDKFTGDGIMAVFGAPIAHEDHARRACYAALRMLDDVSEYAAELRRKHGLNFSTRIGINSGEVIAGAIGDGGDGNYTAIGHTVGLAQRMETLAEPGKAYLAEAAAEQAAGFLDLDDLGEFEIKGSSRPVRVYELEGIGSARSRLDLSRERGFSRFVGREEELTVLEEGFEAAQAGDGAVVGIAAEAGLGKSRLTAEFVDRCRAQGIEVYQAQAQAHGQETPFAPVLQILRAYFGVSDSDSDRISREKIAGRALLLDPGLIEDLPVLFEFMGLPDPDRPAPQLSPEARQRALRGLLCKLLHTSRRDATVNVVEDLHWMDEGSDALLGELLGSVAGTKTLVVLNYRPEYSPTWGELPNYRHIPLEPLGPADTEKLLRDLVGEDPSLDGLAELIHERTAGNPFFIEEIVRELSESGALEGERGSQRLVQPVCDVKVPASVQTVLAARIDRLDPDAKRLLQAMSVAGKEVAEPALMQISGFDDDESCGEALKRAIDAEFLYEAELYPERVIAFRHPLTLEVAYGTQLADQRARTHAAVAQATIDLNPERHDELAGLIAHHYEAGGELREAARWSARGAYWAGHSQPREAMRMWQSVVRLVPDPEEDAEAAALAVNARLMLLDYAWRLGMERDEEAKLVAEAEEIATRTDDKHSLALLKTATGVRPGRLRPPEPWLTAAEEATELADETGDIHLRVAIRAIAAYPHLVLGDFDGYEAILEEMIELIDGDRSIGAGILVGSPLAYAYMSLGLARRERARLDESEELFAKALRIAEEDGDPETACWVKSNHAYLVALKGDIDEGLELSRRSLEETERLGDIFSRTLATSNLAAVQLMAGDPESALASIEAAERIYREAMPEDGEMAIWRASVRSEALTGVGRADEAMAVAEAGAEEAREYSLGWSLPLALRALAKARAAAGRAGVAEALEEGEALARSRGCEMSANSIAAEREALAAAG
ncbi:MAG TPA: adenylate/guanylate cyclase domain-containing protein [Solirubrobacterales bacterium]|nr:adenylate/guanylate cyclase domain-containing protein [Solirubrobacterales bacterium]